MEWAQSSTYSAHAFSHEQTLLEKPELEKKAAISELQSEKRWKGQFTAAEAARKAKNLYGKMVWQELLNKKTFMITAPSAMADIKTPWNWLMSL